MAPPSITRRDFAAGAVAAAAGAALGPGVAGVAATPQRRPNILFFFPDQHRPDWMGAARGTAPVGAVPGGEIPVPTPHLDALARRGAHFTRAFCPSPLCAPSRACLATGREYERCGVRDNEEDLPAGTSTVYRLLRDAGYHVMGAGKVDLAKGSRTWGLDGTRHQEAWGFSDLLDTCGKIDGMLAYYGVRSSLDVRPRAGREKERPRPEEPYLAYLESLDPPRGAEFAEDMLARVRGRRVELAYGDTRPSPLDDAHYLDNWIAERGLALLDGAPSDRPWFHVVNFAGPHAPTDVTRRMDALYRGPERTIDAFPQPHAYRGTIAPETHTAIRQSYAAMIENIDRWLGIYLDALERRRELENTLVVWSSDHGEMLGDHGNWDKWVPWQASVSIPLVVAGPGVEPGRRDDALVSLIDLAPTFLELAGASIPGDYDARSLVPVLAGRERRHRDHVLSGLAGWRMVFDGRHKLVRGSGRETTFSRPFGPGPLLFDLAEDPWEDRDVAAARPEIVKRLGELLPAAPVVERDA